MPNLILFLVLFSTVACSGPDFVVEAEEKPTPERQEPFSYAEEDEDYLAEADERRDPSDGPEDSDDSSEDEDSSEKISESADGGLNLTPVLVQVITASEGSEEDLGGGSDEDSDTSSEAEPPPVSTADEQARTCKELQCSLWDDRMFCDGTRCRCPAGLYACEDWTCIDVQTTNQHCGACGNACSGGYSCVSGVCVL